MKIALTFFLIFVLSCSKKESVVVTFPLFLECEKVVEHAKEYLELTSNDKNYTLGLMVEKFDSLSRSHSELIGFVKLYSTGYWVGLDGSSPRDNLLAHASSILSDCMPNNAIVLESNEKDRLDYIVSGLIKRNNVYLDYSEKDGSLIIHYNDASYGYLQASKAGVR